MDAQLKQLIELQTEQNQLLKKYLWRFRFSLIALLLLTTAICICLGIVMYSQKQTVRIAPAGTWTTPGGFTFAPANPTDVTPVPFMPPPASVRATPPNPDPTKFIDPAPGQ